MALTTQYRLQSGAFETRRLERLLQENPRAYARAYARGWHNQSDKHVERTIVGTSCCKISSIRDMCYIALHSLCVHASYDHLTALS